jgi:uncharacterized membrane protein
MTINKYRILLPLAVLGLYLVSTGCYYDKEELLYPGNTCDTTKVTYSGTVTTIINQYCTSCHSTGAGPTSGAGIILDTYNTIIPYVNNGRLMGSLNHLSGYSAMPKGQAQLPTCNLKQLQAWINKGAPQN